MTFVLPTVEKAKSVNEDYRNLRACAWLQHVFSRVMLLSETAMLWFYEAPSTDGEDKNSTAKPCKPFTKHGIILTDLFRRGISNASMSRGIAVPPPPSFLPSSSVLSVRIQSAALHSRSLTQPLQNITRQCIRYIHRGLMLSGSQVTLPDPDSGSVSLPANCVPQSHHALLCPQ